MGAWVSRPELNELIGPEAAERLCRERGGVPFYVPMRVNPGEGLAALLGFGRAHALSESYGGGYITVPLIRPEPLKVQIATLLDRGKSAPEIARELHTTERYVRAIARLHGGRTRQLSLLE